MNFTREPIIETIISPKEGCKLLVRSSKTGSGGEEYFVDAVEVVSFGQAFFFRSLEHPKAFLVPVSDYEVIEVKEMRVALKNVSHERNIKIGGGREASFRPASNKEPVQERDQIAAIAEEPQQSSTEEAGLETATSGSRMDKRRDRRRRHRRSSEDQEWSERKRAQKQQTEPLPPDSEQKAQGGGAEDEAKVSSSMFSSLIPPPPTLISQTISRYKDKEFMEKVPPKEVEPKEEKAKKEPPADEEPTGSESTLLHRVSSSILPERMESSSAHFSQLPVNNDPFLF